MSGDDRALRRLGAPAKLLGALALVGGLMLGGITAGAATPSERSIAVPHEPDALDYSPDPPGRFAPVREQFIAEQLGKAFGLAPVGAPASPGALPGPQVDPAAVGKVFRCVNGRQTADPLSPPCDDTVFTGDNGGATSKGVTRDEVRVLILFGCYTECGPRYTDLDAPPSRYDVPGIAELRVLVNYFNKRYQTYGRRVHVTTYSGDGYFKTLDLHPNEAAEFDLVVRPFAAISADPPASDTDYHMQMLASRRMVTFDALGLHPRSYFQSRPGMLWSYWPSVEQQVAQYASYVCQKVVGRPVVIARDASLGHPRRLGLVYDDSPSLPYRAIAASVRRRVEACGGEIVATATTRQPAGESGEFAWCYVPFEASSYQATKLSPGCLNPAFVGQVPPTYRPEWILLEDYWTPGDWVGGFTYGGEVPDGGLGPTFDETAMMVSPLPYQPTEGRPCSVALQEEDPRAAASSAAGIACGFFGSLGQVFTGIQVAGARLTPQSLEAGLRGLPSRPAASSGAPICAYEPGDNSCIKDAHVVQFDADGEDGDSVIGCWRAIERGRRYLPGRWPSGNIDAQIRGDEPCHMVV
jgi:hypothetical protein